MNRYIELNEVTKKIDLPDGQSVVLLDRLAKEPLYGAIECARNIFLIKKTGEVIWQIKTKFDLDGDPFTNIFYEESKLKAYRWDGGVYTINETTGSAIPVSLMK